jgi:hypothetical protein
MSVSEAYGRDMEDKLRPVLAPSLRLALVHQGACGVGTHQGLAPSGAQWERQVLWTEAHGEPRKAETHCSLWKEQTRHSCLRAC